MGNLYIVATPIGNLQDITLRAIDTLKKVDAIACEDTRRAGNLLGLLQISNTTNNTNKPKLISYHEHNESQRIPQLINFLKNGKCIALVSDAGTPTISDPGFKLVRECVQNGIKVESIPGASSVISSLVSSGLPTDKFLFLGYPPKKEGHRKTFFHDVDTMIRIIESTVIILEAPHKLVRTLIEMKDTFGDINIVLARELTKVHEEIRREKISESIEHFKKNVPKGEFVILFSAKKNLK